ncbi:helix-turn-helix transcriptional regulator [Actinokineospora pegani]|uniref:helix-turn-helix transcriptional regulator n=1 Tax=Actinokineospora pegani TaxID=2654637 RepID=UPI001F3A0C9E|nr:helix-turn-helix transcriptional regulator [Actinokineospora pegani]
MAERRKALGLSQEKLAELVGVDTSTIRRWEKGTVTPQPWLRDKIARQLQIPLEELHELLTTGVGSHDTRAEATASRPVPTSVLLPLIVDGRTVLVPVDPHALPHTGPNSGPDDESIARSTNDFAEQDVMSSLDRRSMLKYGLAVSALPALGPEHDDQVTAAMTDARRYLDHGVVDHLRSQLDLVKADDGTLGPASTTPIVLGVLAAVEDHARDVKPDVRRALLELGADAAEFAGFLNRDARNLSDALYWHDRAMEWAQAAGNLPMQGYILLKKAQLSYDDREPARMLTLTQAARQGPWQLPRRVQAEAAQQQARAEAMLGARIDEVERQLDQARSLLSADHGADESPLSTHYGPLLLTMQTALAYSEAGNPCKAVEVYDRELTEQRFSPRDYGFFLSLKAGSLALAGEPDEAARVGLDSAARATRTGSDRTFNELARVVASLKPWQHRPAVRDLARAVPT